VGTDPVRAPWSDAINATIDGRDVSVAVGLGDRIVYTHLGEEPRVLASNEKLLTSMAALARLGPSFRYRTSAAAHEQPRAGVLHGGLGQHDGRAQSEEKAAPVHHPSLPAPTSATS